MRRSSTLLIAVCLAGLGPVAVSPAARADDKEDPLPEKRAASAVDGKELSKADRLCIQKGLQWLSEQQRSDGAFGAANMSKPAAPAAHELACTGLAGLAFLAGGHLPGRGRYGQVLDRAIRYVVAQSETTHSGYLGDANGRMYSHGFAALFLAEVAGVSDDRALRKRVRTALNKAIRLMVVTQDENGGWWYHPNKDSGTNGADISVTICEVMALRAAMQAGVNIPTHTVQRATKLVRQACEENGQFVYRVIGGRNIDSSNAGFPRSAAGVCMLYLLGQYHAPELRRGLHYLDKNLTEGVLTSRLVPEHFFFYAAYYATIALYQWGGESWARHFPVIRGELLRRQRADGGWPPATHGGRDVSSTAMALIALQVPMRFLPILKR